MKSTCFKRLLTYGSGMMIPAMFSILLHSCRNDELITEIQPLTQQPAYNNQLGEFYAKFQAPATVTTFTAANGTTITGPKGTTVIINANSLLDKNGVPPTGQVKVEFKEAVTFGEMIMNHKPTAGPDGEIFHSGGEVFLDISYNGEPMQLQPGNKIQIFVPKSPDPLPGMKVYGGIANDSTGVTWIDDSLFGTVQDTMSSFWVMLDNLNYKWINIDKIYGAPGAKYSLNANITLPWIVPGAPGGSSPTELKCESYLLIKAINSLLPVQYDGKKYSIHDIPQGTSATLVCIFWEKRSNRFFLVRQPVVFNSNLNLNLAAVEMSETALKNEINLL